jgi:hypothetical protein
MPHSSLRFYITYKVSNMTKHENALSLLANVRRTATMKSRYENNILVAHRERLKEVSIPILHASQCCEEEKEEEPF